MISGSTIEDFKNIWFEYFDLGRDYSEIKAKLRKDSIMEKAIDFGHGIRLLKQDVWEMLISFIISANNRIPMIMKITEEISRVYGEEIRFGNSIYHTFPGAGQLSRSSIEQLKICGGGFRCGYIVQASAMVQNNTVDIKKFGDMHTDDARNELMRVPGAGPKVADCVLLYSGTKYDVFPTDIWVKRVMEELYFKREARHKEIRTFAKDYFGELAGFAQQYLFYYARENRIGAG